MKKYTVICYYEDNCQPFMHFTEADSPEGAARKTAEDCLDEDGYREGSRLVLVEVIEGHHQGVLCNEMSEALADFLPSGPRG